MSTFKFWNNSKGGKWQENSGNIHSAITKGDNDEIIALPSDNAVEFNIGIYTRTINLDTDTVYIDDVLFSGTKDELLDELTTVFHKPNSGSGGSGDVTLNGAQTLTNKTIDGGNNTLQNIPLSAIDADDTTPLTFKTVGGQSIIGTGDITVASSGSNVVWVEDFITGTTGWKMFVTSSGTSAATAEQPAPAANGFGWVRLNTGTTATGRTSISTSQAGVLPSSGNTGIYTAEFRMILNNRSTGTETFRFAAGFNDVQTSADAVDGCYFTNSTTDNLLYMVNSSGSTRTTTATDVTLTDGMVLKLKVVMNVTTQTATYYVNGTLKGTLTTNFPQSYTAITFGIYKSAGTTARTIDLDRITLSVED